MPDITRVSCLPEMMPLVGGSQVLAVGAGASLILGTLASPKLRRRVTRLCPLVWNGEQDEDDPDDEEDVDLEDEDEDLDEDDFFDDEEDELDDEDDDFLEDDEVDDKDEDG